MRRKQYDISWNPKNNKTENCGKKRFADVDFFCIQILPRNIGIVHFNNLIYFPETEHDKEKWRVLNNDQNWKIELSKLYLANG